MIGIVGGNSKKQPPKFTRKQIGFIKKEQLEYNGVWLLKRVSPICEGCSSSQGYNIFLDTYSRFLSKKSHHLIACAECEDSFELDYEEYLKIKKIVKLNQAHEEGKLSDQEYNYKLDKMIKKLME